MKRLIKVGFRGKFIFKFSRFQVFKFSGFQVFKFSSFQVFRGLLKFATNAENNLAKDDITMG